ncbi:hypothetical protein LY78DRAFT_720878 [Colletotrichum sublineola]|nr:hypothetical protein LY78DRAFT_720878 [Colletotrichum sublineola]
MVQFNDRAGKHLAVLFRTIGFKKEKPKYDTKVDEVEAKVNIKVDCCICCHDLEAHTAPEHSSTVAAKKMMGISPKCRVSLETRAGG